MLIQKMVDKVNQLNQADGDLSYLELKFYFDEAIDTLNEAIHREVFDYLPDNYLEDDNYTGIPNVFQSKFMCYFVAAKSLAELDDFDDQKEEYDRIWKENLVVFANYYFNEVLDLEIDKDYGFTVIEDEEVI